MLYPYFRVSYFSLYGIRLLGTNIVETLYNDPRGKNGRLADLLCRWALEEVMLVGNAEVETAEGQKRMAFEKW